MFSFRKLLQKKYCQSLLQSKSQSLGWKTTGFDNIFY